MLFVFVSLYSGIIAQVRWKADNGINGRVVEGTLETVIIHVL